MNILFRSIIILSFFLFPVTVSAENYFHTVLGKSEEETRDKIDSVWRHFFTPADISRFEMPGEKSVYYLDGPDLAFVMDTGSNDVRTEGMSYGMMIAVQLDHQEEFDRLWRWSKTHMAYPADSPWDGYFCWQCATNGHKIGGSNASDGELYYVTALLLAGRRWNNPVYTSEALDILHKIMSKDGSEGVYSLFDPDTMLITFVPDDAGHGFTDPSYMLPAFLQFWAENVSPAESDFWRQAADAARDHLILSSHPISGLHPDYSTYSAAPYSWPHAGYDTSRYQYDAIRCAMNIGMDSYLYATDSTRQADVIFRMLQFFADDDYRHAHFNVDGSDPDGDFSCGMAGTSAVGAIALVNSPDPERQALAFQAIQRLWDTKPPTGKYRYYEGMVYFLSLLHLSGNFSLN